MSIPSDSLPKISSFSLRGTLQPLGRELPSSEEKTTKATSEILQKAIQQEESTPIDENHNISSIIRGDLGLMTIQSTQKNDLLEKLETTQDTQEDDLFGETPENDFYDIRNESKSEALQEEALSVATQSEALQEESLSVATQIEATHENMLSVAEEVQEVAKNTLSIQEENQALTKNNASLEEKFAARNLNHLALQDLNTI